MIAQERIRRIEVGVDGSDFSFHFA
jgi:hypothetical protein